MNETGTDEYRKLLNEHDWTFEYSDDGRNYRKGLDQRANLLGMQKRLDPDFAIWNEICPPQYRK